MPEHIVRTCPCVHYLRRNRPVPFGAAWSWAGTAATPLRQPSRQESQPCPTRPTSSTAISPPGTKPTTARRRELVGETFAETATYRDPVQEGRGRNGIDTMIAAAQARFPGMRFGRIGEVDSHGDSVRFRWSLSPAGDVSLVEGTDFATIAGGRLASVTGFFDKLPGRRRVAPRRLPPCPRRTEAVRRGTRTVPRQSRGKERRRPAAP